MQAPQKNKFGFRNQSQNSETNKKIIPLFAQYEHIPVHSIFENRVKRCPKKIAVKYMGETFTYEYINSKANQLARFLLTNYDVSAGDIVCVSNYRCVETLINILAILKTGAAYLPIDTEYPLKKLDYYIEKSKARVIITTQSSINNAEKITGVKLIVPSIHCEEINSLSNINLDIVIDTNALAYVLFTSGSTGNPKGVLISHKSIVNTLIFLEKKFPVGKNDTYMLKTNLVFDVSLTELFGWFIGNGSVLILESGKEKDPEYIIEQVKRGKITHINFVPTMLEETVSRWHNCTSQLKYLFVAGEAFPLNLAKKASDTIKGSVQVINLYGPTEVSVYTTWYKYEPHNKKMYIGKAIDNIYLYVLDESLEKVQDNDIGELYIGGQGLSNGYLNNPELTNKFFIEDPFNKNNKIYKTGDLVRLSNNGHLEYIGRKDRQIKLRGFRIETTEIETAITSIKNVRNVLVTEKETITGNRQLAAYIIFDGDYVKDNRSSVSYVKTEAKKLLPSYMIPDIIFLLSEYPKLPSGKIDMNKLITTDYAYKNEGSEKIPPKSKQQQFLLDICEKTLGLNNISIDDDIFDLGAHSLAVMQIQAKVMKKYNIALCNIFENKTVRKIAETMSPNTNAVKLQIKNAITNVSKNREILDKHHNYFAQKQIPKNLNMDKYSTHNLSQTQYHKNILITGVTGFLGIYLLKKFLESTDSTIYVILRATTIRKAKYRLVSVWSKYFTSDINKYIKNNRIEVFAGDLSVEKFDLDRTTYYYLADNVDCIINSAGNVKHFGLYEKLYSDNVLSVENILKFATCTKLKELQHMSTISIANSLESSKFNTVILREEIEPNCKIIRTNNYSYTKIIAEKRIIDATLRLGLKANIYRLGNIGFDSVSGKMQTNIGDNAVSSVIKALINIGYIPDCCGFDFNIMNVDQVTDGLFKLIGIKSLKSEIMHLVNSNTITARNLYEAIKKEYENITYVSREKFLAKLTNTKKNGIDDVDIINILTHIYNYKELEKGKYISTHKTQTILNTINFRWNKIDGGMIKKFIKTNKYFSEVGQ